MTVSELIEFLQDLPALATIYRQDSNNIGDPIERKVSTCEYSFSPEIKEEKTIVILR